MINDNYLNGVALKMANGSYTIPSHLAFGSTTGTLTAADIITSGEFDRNPLSTIEANSNIVKYIGNRLSVEASNEIINVIGLHNASGLASTGNVQANMLLPALVHTTAFDINVEFWFTFNRG